MNALQGSGMWFDDVCVGASFSTAVTVRTFDTLSGREAAAILVRSTAGNNEMGSSRPISLLLLIKFVPAVSSSLSCSRTA